MKTKAGRKKKINQDLPTRKEFFEHDEDIVANICGEILELEKKQFSTGSLGWHKGTKLHLRLTCGKSVTCSVNVLITIIGSKEAVEQ